MVNKIWLRREGEKISGVISTVIAIGAFVIQAFAIAFRPRRPEGLFALASYGYPWGPYV